MILLAPKRKTSTRFQASQSKWNEFEASAPQPLSRLNPDSVLWDAARLLSSTVVVILCYLAGIVARTRQRRLTSSIPRVFFKNTVNTIISAMMLHKRYSTFWSQLSGCLTHRELAQTIEAHHNHISLFICRVSLSGHKYSFPCLQYPLTYLITVFSSSSLRAQLSCRLIKTHSTDSMKQYQGRISQPDPCTLPQPQPCWWKVEKPCSASTSLPGISFTFLFTAKNNRMRMVKCASVATFSICSIALCNLFGWCNSTTVIGKLWTKPNVWRCQLASPALHKHM